MTRFQMVGARHSFAGALALMLAGACSSTVEPVSGDSQIFVANATAGTLDVTIDGEKKLTALSVNGLSAAFTMAAGSHQVRLLDGLGTTTELTVRTSVDTPRTVVAYSRTSSGGTTGVATAVLADTGALVPAGKSKLRVAHLAANAGNIEIWRSQPDFQSGISIMTPFPYLATSPYLQSDPGAWEVWLTPANSTAKALSTGPIQVPTGERRTVLLLDGAAGPRFVVVAE